MIQVLFIPSEPRPGDDEVLVYLPHHWLPDGRAFRVVPDIVAAVDLRHEIQDGVIETRYR